MEGAYSWLNQPLFPGSFIQIWMAVAAGAGLGLAIVLILLVVMKKGKKKKKGGMSKMKRIWKNVRRMQRKSALHWKSYMLLSAVR